MFTFSLMTPAESILGRRINLLSNTTDATRGRFPACYEALDCVLDDATIQHGFSDLFSPILCLLPRIDPSGFMREKSCLRCFAFLLYLLVF
jgi:hypothetical protein